MRINCCPVVNMKMIFVCIRIERNSIFRMTPAISSKAMYSKKMKRIYIKVYIYIYIYIYMIYKATLSAEKFIKTNTALLLSSLICRFVRPVRNGGDFCQVNNSSKTIGAGQS